MYKYQLLHKPTLSGWPSRTRWVKHIVVCVVFIIIASLVVPHWMRNASLARLYNFQMWNAEILDLELRYHPPIDDGDDVWRLASINHSNIFSAYLDIRPEVIFDHIQYRARNETTWAMVRVIGIFPTSLKDAPLTCYYKYRPSDRDNVPIIRSRPAASVHPIAKIENGKLLYTPFFVLCELTLPNDMNYDFSNEDQLPTEITVSANGERKFKDLNDSEFIPIHYPQNGIADALTADKFMAVCIKVLHHEFDRVVNLVEFIEFYRMMGADHFTFYNSSISPNVSRVLDYYKKNEVIAVLQWHLPPYYVFGETLRVDGIFAALNDCLYRSSLLKGYKYVAGVDVDEFIMPRSHSNYRDLMEHLDPGSSSTAASFLFRNIFFYLMYPNDAITQSPDVPIMYLQSKTRRWTNVYEAGERSKYIVRGQDVVELGNHITWERRKTQSILNPRYTEVAVDLDIGASHHYRYCETDMGTCWQRPIMRDTTAHRFTDELGKRVAKVCNEVFENGCPLNNP